MASRPLGFTTEEEYFRIDEAAERRSEYFDGKMYPVEAATRKHSAISTNLIYAITSKLRAKNSNCLANAQDMRVYLPETGAYAYPDLVLSCEPLFSATQENLLNPILIAEILSLSTEGFDIGLKFELYRSIRSLQEYWTIAQDRFNVQQWTIRNGHWTMIEHATRAATIVHPEFEITLDEIYYRVDVAELDTDKAVV